MIATTNLVQNMDAAFERRFLYKVKFEKPELAQRTKIWQSMMPRLSDDTAAKLASCMMPTYLPTQNLLSDAECKICKYKSLIIIFCGREFIEGFVVEIFYNTE